MDLHFIYLGRALPYYGPAALALARRFSGVNISLIGPAAMETSARRGRIEFVALEEFYDSNSFSEARARLSQSVAFRDGFWVKTLERFFVLEQFMAQGAFKAVLHAELDQLLFRVDVLAAALESDSRRGVFVPFHNSSAAVASVFYCNNLESLSALNEYSRVMPTFPHEMAMLAQWSSSGRRDAFALPTMATAMQVGEIRLPVSGPTESELGGVVDAAQLGQWVAGIEPRNVPLPKSHRNKFVDQPGDMLLSRRQLESLTFGFEEPTGLLYCTTDTGETHRVYNLHLHSKIHASLAKGDSPPTALVDLANSRTPQRIRGTLALRTKYFTTDRMWPAISHPTRTLRAVGRRARTFATRRAKGSITAL